MHAVEQFCNLSLDYGFIHPLLYVPLHLERAGADGQSKTLGIHA